MDEECKRNEIYDDEDDKVPLLIYRVLRVICGFGTLFTALAKIPLIVVGVRFAILVIQHKKEKEKQQNQSSDENGNAPIDLEVKISVLILAILYLLHIIVPFVTFILIVFNKSRCYWPYISVTVLWLTLVTVSYFVNAWPVSVFGAPIVIVQHLIRGFWIFEAPMHWELQILRASVILDFFMVPLLVGMLVVQRKYGFARRGVDCRKLAKEYNLVATL